MKYIILTIIIIGLSGCGLQTINNTPTNDNKSNEINAGGDINAPATSAKLDLSRQGLKELPKSVLSKTNLEELDLSGNNLTGALPAEIRMLSKLKILRASDNQMTGVPAEIGQLSNLEILDLSNNNLTGLPYELGNLKNLKTLDLSGNQVSEYDLNIIKEKLPQSTNIIK